MNGCCFVVDASDPDSSIAAETYIIMGYSSGVQFWFMDATGEAREVLSLRQGPVKCARVLPNPKEGGELRV